MSTDTTIRIAAAQYAVNEPRNWGQAASVIRRAIEEGAGTGAQLLVFPEYGAMMLSALFAPKVREYLHAQIAALQALRDDYVDLHRELSAKLGVWLLAGSFPWQLDDGSYRNRAWFVGPGGELGFQDKRVMTRFEREQWHIGGGADVPIKVFDTPLGRIGVNICYDVEFPLIARAQCEAGATLILVPSCTDTLAGYYRVRVGAQARALENQCVVVQSPLVGEAPWSPAIDVNIGAAGFYGPPDRGFPDDGILVRGTVNEPGWIACDIDLQRIARVRTEGQIFNHRDWPEQLGLVCETMMLGGA